MLVLPVETLASHVQSRLVNLPCTPAVSWYAFVVVLGFTGVGKKSRPRNRFHGAVAADGPAGLPAAIPLPAGPAKGRGFSRSGGRGGGGRLASCGIGACHTVIAGE